MHEFADGLLSDGATQSHAAVMSVTPRVSVYWPVNVTLAPPPDAGVTESTVTSVTGGGGAAAGIVQSPRSCQPVLLALPRAYMKMFFAPEYAAPNVTGNATVSRFPDA